MSESLAGKEQLRGLKEEVRALIDEKVREVPMSLESGIQARDVYLPIASINVMDLIGDVMGEDPNIIGESSDWLNYTHVFLRTEVDINGIKSRYMSTSLLSTFEENRRGLNFAFMDLGFLQGTITHRVKEHNGGNLSNPFADPLEADVTSSQQLEAIKGFLQGVLPVIR